MLTRSRRKTYNDPELSAANVRAISWPLFCSVIQFPIPLPGYPSSVSPGAVIVTAFVREPDVGSQAWFWRESPAGYGKSSVRRTCADRN
jgi:hypothetical protein